MKNIFLCIILMLPVLTSRAQTNCKVKKAYAFYTISMPGMQMADENGNPIPPKPAIGRFIYIEWSGSKKPEIETVLYNNKVLAATLTAVDSNSIIPGKNFSTNSNFKITAKKCNSLWKIELQPAEGNTMPEQGCKNIIIKIKSIDGTCAFKLTKETELTAMPRY